MSVPPPAIHARSCQRFSSSPSPSPIYAYLLPQNYLWCLFKHQYVTNNSLSKAYRSEVSSLFKQRVKKKKILARFFNCISYNKAQREFIRDKANFTNFTDNPGVSIAHLFKVSPSAPPWSLLPDSPIAIDHSTRWIAYTTELSSMKHSFSKITPGFQSPISSKYRLRRPPDNSYLVATLP